MNKLNFSLIATAACLLFGRSAMAQSMSKSDFKSGQDKISVEYKADKAACALLAANAKDICVAEAQGKEKVAKAEIDASYKPSIKTQYEVRIAKAKAAYAIANEKCDDLAGNTKDICVTEAKSAQTAAKADAKVQMKTSDANATANETSSAAHVKASTQTVAVREQAVTDKLDAQYKVEKEKCDSYAGTAKDNCITQAKARYSK